MDCSAKSDPSGPPVPKKLALHPGPSVDRWTWRQKQLDPEFRRSSLALANVPADRGARYHVDVAIDDDLADR